MKEATKPDPTMAKMLERHKSNQHDQEKKREGAITSPSYEREAVPAEPPDIDSDAGIMFTIYANKLYNLDAVERFLGRYKP